MQKSKSYNAYPSYYFILDYLNEHNISFEEFVRQMEWRSYEVRALKNGTLLIKEALAKRIEEKIGLSAKSLLKYENMYRQNIIKVMLENELGIIVDKEE